MLAPLRRNQAVLALTLATFAALALAWAVRRSPFAISPVASLDALAACFIAATAFGLALAAAARPPASARPPWLTLAAALILVAAYLTTITLAIPILITLASALVAPRALFASGDQPLAAAAAAPARRRRITVALHHLMKLGMRAILLAPGALAGAALLAGYGTLALRGGSRYDAPTAGAALDSLVFWLVLLAALIPLLPLALPAITKTRRPPGPQSYRHGDEVLSRAAAHNDAPITPGDAIVRIAWLYPLVRLYSLGPWNNGWALATLLLAAAVALWSSVSALAHHDTTARLRLMLFSQLALALAAFGLGTGAGVAAGCFAMLAALTLAAASNGQHVSSQTDSAVQPLVWLISGAIPLSAPFVAAWMLLGAGVAGSVPLVSAAAWLVALISAAGIALRPPHLSPRALIVAGAASLALGVLAPVVLSLLVQPVIEQLQGGLSVFGDVDIWPWVGLTMLDSGRRGVAALPSLAVAALMVVLSALVLLIVPHRSALSRSPDATPPNDPLDALRAAVPWLRDARPAEHSPDDAR
jgi:hypothetical protein